MGLNSSQPCCVYNSRNPPRALNPHLPLLSPSIKKLTSAQARATRQHFATARRASAESPAQARTLSSDPAHCHGELPAELDVAAPPLNSAETPAKSLHAPAGSYDQLSPSVLAPNATLQHQPALTSPKVSSGRTTPPATIGVGKRRPAWAASSPPRYSSPVAPSCLALPSGLLRPRDAQGGHTRGTAEALDAQLPHHQPQLPLAEGQTPARGDAAPLDQATNLAPTTNGLYQMVAQLCYL